MAHVHTFASVAPNAAGIIQYVIIHNAVKLNNKCKPVSGLHLAMSQSMYVTKHHSIWLMRFSQQRRSDFPERRSPSGHRQASSSHLTFIYIRGEV